MKKKEEVRREVKIEEKERSKMKVFEVSLKEEKFEELKRKVEDMLEMESTSSQIIRECFFIEEFMRDSLDLREYVTIKEIKKEEERKEVKIEDLDLFQLKQDILDCIEKKQYKIIRTNTVTFVIDPIKEIVKEVVLGHENLVTNVDKYVEDLTNYLKECEIE